MSTRPTRVSTGSVVGSTGTSYLLRRLGVSTQTESAHVRCRCIGLVLFFLFPDDGSLFIPLFVPFVSIIEKGTVGLS